MAADAKSRAGVRAAVAAGLTTALVGTGKPVQAVYGYKKRDFANQSPVVLVMSGGARRTQHGMGTLKYHSWFRLELLVFVADPVKDESWSDEDVEDRIDLIEKEIADWLADNRKTADWAYLVHEGTSELFPAKVGGESYTMERILLTAEAYDV